MVHVFAQLTQKFCIAHKTFLSPLCHVTSCAASSQALYIATTAIQASVSGSTTMPALMSDLI